MNVYDFLFDDEGKLLGVGESTRAHQRDIILMDKGWNKFFPALGVGMDRFVGHDTRTADLMESIHFEMLRDGMRLTQLTLSGDDPSQLSIQLDAYYEDPSR